MDPKVVLPPEEIALQLYEHLNSGLVTGKLKFVCQDAEWLQTFTYLMNLTLYSKAKNAGH
jgi:hypothetical protein